MNDLQLVFEKVKVCMNCFDFMRAFLFLVSMNFDSLMDKIDGKLSHQTRERGIYSFLVELYQT